MSAPGRRAIRAIVRRDLSVVRRNKAVMIPLVVIPALFVVVFPTVIGLIATAPESTNELDTLVQTVPPWVLDGLRYAADGTTLDGNARLAGVLLGYLVPPMTLVVPLIFAMVIATDAVAGERERGTLEALLLAPVRDRDLLVAKLGGALIPALIAGIGGAMVYACIADLTLWPALGRLLLPNPTWLLLVLWVGPALVTTALGIAVYVSARARTAQGAQQIAGVVVVPVVFVGVGQFSGLLFLGPWLLVPVGAVLWTLAAWFVRLGSRALARDRVGPRLT